MWMEKKYRRVCLFKIVCCFARGIFNIYFCCCFLFNFILHIFSFVTRFICYFGIYFCIFTCSRTACVGLFDFCCFVFVQTSKLYLLLVVVVQKYLSRPPKYTTLKNMWRIFVLLLNILRQTAAAAVTDAAATCKHTDAPTQTHTWTHMLAIKHWVLQQNTVSPCFHLMTYLDVFARAKMDAALCCFCEGIRVAESGERRCLCLSKK